MGGGGAGPEFEPGNAGGYTLVTYRTGTTAGTGDAEWDVTRVVDLETVATPENQCNSPFGARASPACRRLRSADSESGRL